MGHKRKLKKFYEKEKAIQENKRRFKPKMKVSKKILDVAERQNNNAIKKRNRKNINYAFGGEYKDRHNEW